MPISISLSNLPGLRRAGAIDFIADKEAPVLAAADELVTFVKDDSNTGDLTQSIGVIQTSL